MIPFHPLVVHFPIVLLIVAGVFYLLHFFIKDMKLDKIGFFIHAAGLIGCVAAILTGDYAEAELIQTHDIHELVEEHEMLGMITTWAFGIMAVWAFLRQKSNIRLERIVFTVVFFLGLGFMGVASHHGGQLVYEKGAGVVPMREVIQQQRDHEQLDHQETGEHEHLDDD